MDFCNVLGAGVRVRVGVLGLGPVELGKKDFFVEDEGV